MSKGSKPVIELLHVTKMYGKALGVQDVSLSVPAGSVFGFLGPNGAGKTTTISMLIDLLRPTSGSISVFGFDSIQDSVAIRRRVGFLAGDMALDRSLTGWQQLEYLGNIHGTYDKAYVLELAERLDCKLEKRFKNLSRGNKQKVGLIAALMHKPELLILDEPTSGLDPLIQAEFNKLILEHKKAGKTAFISSHVLSEVQEICDSVTFIREGKIVETKGMVELGRELPKVFSVQGASAALKKRLGSLSGVTLAVETDGNLRGTYRGEVTTLLGVVAKAKVKDFTLQDADLETVFMKYYGDGNA